MKILIFSDLHANFLALQHIIAFCEKNPVDAIYCLGDIVGYHPYPKECIHWMEENRIPCLKGNHEALLLGELGGWSRISERAQHTLSVTRTLLDEEELAYLRSLPFSMHIASDVFLLHANYQNLHKTINTRAKALEEFYTARARKHRIVFFGHTHRPGGFYWNGQDNEVIILDYREPIELDDKGYYLINPGSAGEPRHGLPFTFLVLDTDRKCINFISFRLSNAEIETLKKKTRDTFGGFSLKRLPAQLREKLRKFYYKMST